MSEPKTATQDQIEQQRRVIMTTMSSTAAYLTAIDKLRGERATYTQLGLGDDLILSDDAFAGTGTDKATYRAAINSIDTVLAFADSPAGGNLEKFGR